MKVGYFASVEEVNRDSLIGACVVVIDVLRASSTIVAALASGAERVIPIADVATACRLARPGERMAKILAGERHGTAVDGFDLGNSPREFSPERVGGKTIVFTTTNGTRALSMSAKAGRVIVAALTNVHAVAEAIRGESSIVVICCGSEGSVASEDLLCGGLLLELLGDLVDRGALNDAARLSLLLAERFGGNVENFLRETDHGRRLVSLGFEADIAACAASATIDIVPALREGAITS